MSAMKPIPSKTPYNTRKPPTNYSNDRLIKVYCRIRPTDLESNCIKILNNEKIETHPPHSSLFKKSNVGKSMHYKFTNIFDKSTQQQTIFDEISLDLIKSALNGENALLFSYGVTGSGKTQYA
ncbi:hypothetical protein A3Q56_08331 [Intoshia linei]|uniref:Kinesin motor domain-containing protein n=1 Tax=Intoshia linei TaxID=1819745 RepID=A0A177APK9_9BILA|nr:hypothetical protein A3Q56_08331 [Intoshia linei]